MLKEIQAVERNARLLKEITVRQFLRASILLVLCIASKMSPSCLEIIIPPNLVENSGLLKEIQDVMVVEINSMC